MPEDILGWHPTGVPNPKSTLLSLCFDKYPSGERSALLSVVGNLLRKIHYHRLVLSFSKLPWPQKSSEPPATGPPPRANHYHRQGYKSPKHSQLWPRRPRLLLLITTGGNWWCLLPIPIWRPVPPNICRHERWNGQAMSPNRLRVGASDSQSWECHPLERRVEAAQRLTPRPDHNLPCHRGATSAASWIRCGGEPIWRPIQNKRRSRLASPILTNRYDKGPGSFTSSHEGLTRPHSEKNRTTFLLQISATYHCYF